MFGVHSGILEAFDHQSSSSRLSLCVFCRCVVLIFCPADKWGNVEVAICQSCSHGAWRITSASGCLGCYGNSTCIQCGVQKGKSGVGALVLLQINHSFKFHLHKRDRAVIKSLTRARTERRHHRTDRLHVSARAFLRGEISCRFVALPASSNIVLAALRCFCLFADCESFVWNCKQTGRRDPITLFMVIDHSEDTLQ